MALLIYKQRDPVPNKKNTPASNFHHIKYIATRPRVMKNELSNHGLFGNAETGDITVIESLHKMQRLILQKSHERKNIHRGIISFTAETAKKLDLNNKDDFLRLVKQNIHILADKNNIKIQNLKWIAAAHNERDHPHVHIMFWDDAQTMPQSYVSPKIPNEIRKQLIKSIFADELIAFYEEKKKATVSLRQITNEMVEEFENFVSTLDSAGYSQIKYAATDKSTFDFHFNGEFKSKELTEFIIKLFDFKEKLPKSGRLLYKFLPTRIKNELDKLVDEIIDSNEQLQGMLNLYVDSKLNLTEMYSDNLSLYEIAAKEYTTEAKKIIANRILLAVKTIIKKEYELKNQEYTERMKRAYTKELICEVFFFLGKLVESNYDARHNSKFMFSTELSKQAKKEKAKELADSSGYEMNN
ncbi:MAG: relaxase MobL [Clostridia bacterium]|nr:relaxase MobL [Clostridia bacterium]